ncbi:MAG TPA: SLC13 family permease [Nitrososphaerales archaeon]|nr:SLC13 family permease [Nitrososphaerales archaeon]
MTPADPGVYLSLALLFGVAAQFRAMDGYTSLRSVVASLESKVGVLAAISIVTVAVSPFVLNDVLVLILTPVAIKYARQFDVDPAPIVAAEVVFANLSSSLTPFGNPQNIILWSATGISVLHFVEGTLPRVLTGILLASLVLVPFALRAGGRREMATAVGPATPLVYLVVVVACLVVGDFLGAQPYLPLGIGFLAGFAVTRRSLPSVRKEFEVRSLLLLWGFVLAV